MTKQEWDFVLKLVQDTARRAYEIRDEEVKAGKPLNPEQFILTAGHKLTLEKELRKALTTKRR